MNYKIEILVNNIIAQSAKIKNVVASKNKVNWIKLKLFSINVLYNLIYSGVTNCY